MKTSQNGLTLIEQQEAWEPEEYLDKVGRPTIGYGHLIKPGEHFPDTLTLEQGQELLAQDVAIAEAAVNAMAPQANQNQFDALVDFTFNLGSVALKTMLGHGWDQVPVQIPRWNQAGGEVLSDLVKRRAAEVALFNTPFSET